MHVSSRRKFAAYRGNVGTEAVFFPALAAFSEMIPAAGHHLRVCRANQ